MNGEHVEVIGPKRVRLFFSTIRFLTRFKAESNQYLVVKHRDGRVEHIKGPTAMYCNPSRHDEILVKDCIHLHSKSDLILVHNSGLNPEHKSSDLHESSTYEPASNSSIVQGPTMFTPSPYEHVHDFHWSEVVNGSLKRKSGETQILHISGKTMTVPIDIKVPNTPYSIKIHLTLGYKLDASADELLFHKDPVSKIFHYIAIQGQSLTKGLKIEEVKKWTTTDWNTLVKGSTMMAYLKNVADESCITITSLSVSDYSFCEDLQRSIFKENSLQKDQEAKLKVFQQSVKLKQEEQKNVMADVELQKIRMENDHKLDLEGHQMKIDALKREAEREFMKEKAKCDRLKLQDERMITLCEKLKSLDVDVSGIVSSNKELKEELGISDLKGIFKVV
ncbi:hypothetical protein CTEN210_12444 [Chaetoceros tenuissimus]|uniref:Uncharacterized protein n=1 Tax=Chaetoceros tenuissimus TaxID=426638 RepID=A0AAD3HAH7_9STRA|nr:hypothetical protein CTEN210_12444 [Chaetoceros tenuissimus]